MTSATVDEIAKEAAAAMLRGVGQRVTRPRIAVLSQVMASGDAHVSADDIFERVTAEHADVHRATVYRTLESLTEAGVLQHVHLDRGLRAYHLADRAHAHASHLHAQCSRCGRVVDLPPDILGRAAVRIRQASGFELHASHTALSGLCADCVLLEPRAGGH